LATEENDSTLSSPPPRTFESANDERDDSPVDSDIPPIPLSLPITKTGNAHLFKVVALLCLMMTIITLVVLFFIPDSPAQVYLLSLMEWLRQIPKTWGAILLSLLYAGALVFCLPGTPFNLAAGFLFDTWIGSVVNIIGCDLGACIAFFLGRTLGREWAQQKILANKKYELIDKAVEKNGFLIIFLIRLSPVFPFGICNYLFGITTVSFPFYWAATTLGLIPCTVAYTYL